MSSPSLDGEEHVFVQWCIHSGIGEEGGDRRNQIWSLITQEADGENKYKCILKHYFTIVKGTVYSKLL